MSYRNNIPRDALEALVRKILLANVHPRDDDIDLYAYVLFHLGAKPDDTISDFFSRLRAGDYPKFDTVSRTRRKLQQHNPELRSVAYKDRLKKESHERGYYRDETQ